MKRINKIFQSVKKVWYDKIEATSPYYFSKYISALKQDKMIECANTFGTPQYLLDEDMLRERARFFTSTLSRNIPNIQFFYAMKCNDLPYISKVLSQEGFNADVAGGFELALALKLRFNRIIFTSPGKDESEIRLALKNNQKVILNIDNPDEVRRLKEVMKSTGFKKILKVSVRINPDSNVTWSKYGVPLQQLNSVLSDVRRIRNLRLVGLHFHSSWNKTPEKYLKKINALGRYLEENRKLAKELKFLDIGGGYFPEDTAILTKFSFKGELVRLLEEYHEKEGNVPDLNFNDKKFIVRDVDPLENFAIEIGNNLKRSILPHNPKLQIFTEPGRFIVTHSTAILLKVIAEKERAVIVDGGINMVGDYRFEEFSFAPIVNLTRPSMKIRKKTIFGPLCDPSDLWGYSYYGDKIRKGDILAVLHQGAYTFSVAWRFIKPNAKYTVISGERIFLAKKEETFKERYSGCII
jgi:diaminopimelate decarboxylase